MRRTTITLPDEIADVLQREAQRHRTSVSEIARRVLQAHFGLDGGTPRDLPFAKLGSSGRSDTAERIDEILAETWVADIERHRDR